MVSFQAAPQLVNEQVQGLGVDLRVLVVPVLDFQCCDPGEGFIAFSLPLGQSKHQSTRRALFDGIHQAIDHPIYFPKMLASLRQIFLQLLDVEGLPDLF